MLGGIRRCLEDLHDGVHRQTLIGVQYKFLALLQASTHTHKSLESGFIQLSDEGGHPLADGLGFPALTALQLIGQLKKVPDDNLVISGFTAVGLNGFSH